MIIKIILLILCGFLIMMNVIYLRDNHEFYQDALNHRNKFATGFYEFNFVIKIISLCLNGFFILFSYINFQSINKNIIYFFYIENTINILIYLVNIKEKACGTLISRFNSYYLFDYDGQKLIVDEVITTGKYPARPIKFYKVNDWGFEFVTSGCYHGADSCRGQRADWLEFKFKNEKS